MSRCVTTSVEYLPASWSLSLSTHANVSAATARWFLADDGAQPFSASARRPAQACETARQRQRPDRRTRAFSSSCRSEGTSVLGAASRAPRVAPALARGGALAAAPPRRRPAAAPSGGEGLASASSTPVPACCAAPGSPGVSAVASPVPCAGGCSVSIAWRQGKKVETRPASERVSVARLHYPL